MNTSLHKSGYALQLRGLRKSFGSLKVLNGIDLQVETGTIMALLGPNGAGKTTTVNILSTLTKADSGTAKLMGVDVQTAPAEARKLLGLTGQYAAIDELLTGRENLRMMGRLYHLQKDVVLERTERLLTQFDLQAAADRKSSTYSGGMRRRLDLAVSLIASPPVIFLDEPTTGLDPRSRQNMWQQIEQLARNGSTILLTTQYLDEADRLADRIAVLDGGKIIAEGTANELKKQVGKDRAELTFKRPPDYEAAKAYFKGSRAVADDDKLSVTIEADGVKALRVLLEKVEAQKLTVESISLHKPTLDDVFLRFTGHATKSQPKGGQK